MKISQQERQWLLQEKYKGATLASVSPSGKKTRFLTSHSLALTGEALEEFLKDVARIENGEPIDYVIGFSRFLGCDIDLSFRPFIPRPETEFWVEKAIEKIKTKRGDTSIRCLDLCAGSGCIGVALLKHIPNVRVDFVEINENFCKQIRLSCEKNSIERGRFNVLQSNLFENIDGQYDYILSNPPYCATDIPDRVEQSVKEFEPSGALWSGADGLEDIRHLLSDAHQHIKPGGTLYIEFDSLQKDEIAKIIQILPYRSHEFYKDQYDRWRYIIINR